MQTISKVALIAVLSVSAFLSCKQGESPTEEITSEAKVETVSPSQEANPQNKIQKRKFIRTANLKFQVKNVETATKAIEQATIGSGGFVVDSNLESTILEKVETKISQDSLLETTRYTVKNNLILRVPNEKLDTIISAISKQIDFLDARSIKADDVSLQILQNQMAQLRGLNKKKRLEKAIDEKGTKLSSIIDAEDRLGNQADQTDSKKIENLSLEDQINFSTIAIQIYQRDSFREARISIKQIKNSSRPTLSIAIADAWLSGWHIIEWILTFIVQLWSLILLAFIAYFVFNRKFKKQV